MGFVLFQKKEKNKKVEKLEETLKPDYYELAMQEIKEENGIETPTSSLEEETKTHNLDISAFQDNSISFFIPDYILQVKNSLIKGGFKTASNQIEDLEYRFIGNEELGKTDSEPKGDVSLQVAEIFDKTFMNNAYTKSLEGKLNNLNGTASDYKEFHKKYLKKNDSKISYETRKDVLKSLEGLSRWISGEEVEEINKEICNVNKYLLEEIKEETAINNPVLLNKRAANLMNKYDKEFSKEKNNYTKFLGSAYTVSEILDSAFCFNLNPSNEVKTYLHNFLTSKYIDIQTDKNIDKSTKDEAKQIYSKIYERINGVPLQSVSK